MIKSKLSFIPFIFSASFDFLFILFVLVIIFYVRDFAYHLVIFYLRLSHQTVCEVDFYCMMIRC